MQYLITFLEGFISFVSPCMLPLLPLYVSYFAGGAEAAGGRRRTLINAVCFVLGFSLVFCLLGVTAGALGSLLTRGRAVFNLICGLAVMTFGLSYLGLFQLPFFNGNRKAGQVDGAFSAFVFGLVYSISLTPCVGAFLGSALLLASSQGTALQGLLLLLIYSLGLGLPFVISALLLDRLGGAFRFIKKHYRVINLVCGIFLVLVGLLMALGLTSKLMALLQ